jgi:hypothetical protein
LSVPVHHNETLARDAQFIFRPGLEIHIYMRGYFPVSGMFSENSAYKDVFHYPYYPVFHGVVIQTGHSYSAGVQTISIQCASMLHFWQFQQVSTNASIFGPRARNSHLQSSLVGHNYSGKHPYEIIWHLHNDFVSAAAGVGFALSQRTNQTASFGSESLMSITARYWEERFKTRFIKLRMHGATGNLFSAAQAAYVGRASSSELLREFKNRFNINTGPSATGNPFSTAKAVDGTTIPTRLDSIKVYNPGPEDGFDLNLVEMKAFVSDLSQWGQPNLFESTYESKLDIANKICEVTGFEFYQDVDGDFVFKPPMYNLDTSGSRVYRIEDIDIININFDEKEPQATYITAKGSQMKNLAGTGLDNEWGVQGQYIDWRLVAQYGWRPHDFETAYFNNRSAMFFAAMNRLDLLNAPCKSATVTIPIRPEIRPGYPVYIPSLDCFFYCNSFSHSHSVGGQCTTNLQLIAKRAKFFAPKDPTKTGIEAVDLSDLTLPPGPLQIQDDDGRPALAGFPNVVMSLDPFRIDPRMLMLGGDIYTLDKDTLGGIIKIALDKNIIAHLPGMKGGPYYLWTTGKEGVGDVILHFASDFDPASSGSGDADLEDRPVIPLEEGLNALVTQQKNLEQKKKDIQEKRDKLVKKELMPAQKKLDDIGDPGSQAYKDQYAKVQDIQDQINRCDSDAANLQSDFEREMEIGDGTVTSVKTLWLLIHTIIEKSFGGRIDLASTTFLLSMLADKKAVISTASMPGSYRYYSASHPKPEHQGLRLATVDTRAGNAKVSLGSSGLDSPATVKGFTNAASQMQPGGWVPEAQFADITVVNGIKVRNGDPSKPDGVVLPTSEIRELMFTPIRLELDSQRITTMTEKDVGTASESIRQALIASARLTASTNGKDGVTIAEVFDPWVQTVDGWFQTAFVASQGISGNIPEFGTIEPIMSCEIKGVNVSSESDPRSTGIYGISQMSEGELWDLVGNQYAARLWDRQIAPKGSDWPIALAGVGGLDENGRKNILTTFYNSLLGSLGIDTIPVFRKRESVKVKAKTKGSKGVQQPTAYAPVFPVSDLLGYEVVGSFRYGRDVDIDVGGVWSDLINRDPLEALDSRTVDDIVNNAYLKRKGLAGERTRQLLLNIIKQYPGATFRGEGATVLDAKAIETTKDANQLTWGLKNWYLDRKSDSVTKIQLVNAAYTLADLAPFGRSTAPCACRAAEANIVLEDAQNANFIPVVEGLTVAPDADAITQYVAKATAAAGMEWTVRQDALRGTALDRSSSGTVAFFQNLDELYAEANRQVSVSVNLLEEEV